MSTANPSTAAVAGGPPVRRTFDFATWWDRVGIIAVLVVLVAQRRGVGRLPAGLAAGLLVLELALGILITNAGLAPTQTNGIDATIAVTYSAVAVGIMWALAWVLGESLGAARPQSR